MKKLFWVVWIAIAKPVQTSYATANNGVSELSVPWLLQCGCSQNNSHIIFLFNVLD